MRHVPTVSHFLFESLLYLALNVLLLVSVFKYITHHVDTGYPIYNRDLSRSYDYGLISDVFSGDGITPIYKTMIFSPVTKMVHSTVY